MSLIGLQTAVAAIIRHPRKTYDWKPEVFLKQFDLDKNELQIVETLSKHQELNKYGHGQADARLEVMLNHIDRVKRFVPSRVMKNIWFDLYEPTAIYTKSDLKGYFETSIAFLNFLKTNKEAVKRLKRSSPPFIFDMISFEIAELELSRPYCIDKPLLQGSILKHPHFRVVKLNFDLPAWLTSQSEDLSEFERPLILLFVRVEGKFPKIYEITSEFKSFLQGQIGEGTYIKENQSIRSSLKQMNLLNPDL